jgi:hypothetical protein
VIKTVTVEKEVIVGRTVMVIAAVDAAGAGVAVGTTVGNGTGGKAPGTTKVISATSV